MNNFDLHHIQKHVLTATRLLNAFYREHLEPFADKNSDLRSLLLNVRPSTMEACATYFLSEEMESSLDCRMEALHLVLESDGRDLFDSLVLKHSYLREQHRKKINNLEEEIVNVHKNFGNKKNKQRWYHMRGDLDDMFDSLEFQLQTESLQKSLESKKTSLSEKGFDTFIYQITSQLCSMAQQSCDLVDQVALQVASKNENLSVTVDHYLPSENLKHALIERREIQCSTERTLGKTM